jgi:hypothetical protein
MNRRFNLQFATESRPQLRIAAAIVSVLLMAQSARACSVPVFRYALERWTADLFEVDVFYRGSLTTDERAMVSRLEDQSQVNGGAVNWEVVHCNLDEKLAEDLQVVGSALGDVPFPHVVLRRPGGRRGSEVVWSGPLSEAKPALWTSPAWDELVRRLANGDSVVWLVFRGSNEEQSRQLVQQLHDQLPLLAAEIPLPAGVGLPGSELLTRIPLEVRFSVLEIDGQSAHEAIFRRLVIRDDQNIADTAETVVVPVFGRGRAMTTLAADAIDEALLAECSGFLCGACSCQVKQSNPGFDLLLAVNWEERLAGEQALTDPPATTSSSINPAEAADEAIVIPIPPGQQDVPEPEPQERLAISPASADGLIDRWLTWGVLLCASVGLAVGLRRRWISTTNRE